MRTFVALLVSAFVGCAPLTLGSPFRTDPEKIKVAHHTKKDVETMMGQPFRKSVDAKGREIYTYLWADGKGDGVKCIVAFNEEDKVMFVEVVR